MRTMLLILLLCFAVNWAAADCPDEVVYPELMFPEVVIETSLGEIVVELDRQRAPLTVNHFLYHMKNKRFDDNLVHRIVENYVVQTGAFKSDLTEVQACGKLINESGNGLKNHKYTIAMARYPEPHTAGSSYYFNLNDNDKLNPNDKGWGYAVFGQVIAGQAVLDAMNGKQTVFYQAIDAANFPKQKIIVKSVRLKNE